MEASKVVVFQVGNEEYGIPVQNVISIERIQPSTVIPKMPSFMKGVVTIREELVPVIDTGIILYDRTTIETDKSRMIVTKTEDLSVGLIVDDAKEILDIPQEKIKQLNLLAYQKTSYFLGVANLENRLLTLLDPNNLFESLEGIKQIKEHMNSLV
ncbi:chemotaxis protein CheW [Cytobacillus sp. S13-E01]|uniref:chemotaxis protein CheW n=1 Tax=Cytobacillus sp. S13-E01 TaxID=3031326 RepID=UPI0023D886E9|nr:chemotaxis protein CheW [Cytobacillus sp. S13-E01]MDF0727378.1 chemotaxis protein CheW [Cytobacillus sp. S13-E01]